MGFWDIWDSIKNKVVHAGSAVVGAAKSVKKGVGSVAGGAKNIILRRNKKLQEVIDDCVGSLTRLPSMTGEVTNVKIAEADLLNGALEAFQTMRGKNEFKEFVSGHSSGEKGFAGFANFLNNQLNGVEKLEVKELNNNEKALDEALDMMKMKVLPVLSRVKKYSGVGSRVNAFVGPCKVLYGMVADFGTPKGSKAVSSYFGKACEHLRSAAAKKSKEEKGFCKSMCDAYDAVCKMCKYEKLGKKGDKKEGTASGKWYSVYSEDKIKAEDDKIKAVLAICDDKYKSERGFAKRFLKFKGQTKWQELRTLVEKAKNNGIRIGVLDKDGKLVMKQYSGGSSVFTNTHSENEINDNNENKGKEFVTPTPTSTSSNVFPANSNSDGFSVFENSQNGGMSDNKENKDITPEGSITSTSNIYNPNKTSFDNSGGSGN